MKGLLHPTEQVSMSNIAMKAVIMLVLLLGSELSKAQAQTRRLGGLVSKEEVNRIVVSRINRGIQ